MSASRPLLRLPLIENHRRLRSQWGDTTEGNDIVLTESRFFLQHHDGRIRAWRHRGERLLNYSVMLRHIGAAPSIMDNARPHLTHVVKEFFFTHRIELLPWPACSPDLSLIEKAWSMFAQCPTRDIPPAATANQFLVICGRHMDCCTPNIHPKPF
ncbi:UNVERIFIED_CONTAM: hypothetical protein NCL1_32012 [Trichonephila clavipes]